MVNCFYINLLSKLAQNTEKALSLLFYSVFDLHSESGVGAPAGVEGNRAEK